MDEEDFDKINKETEILRKNIPPEKMDKIQELASDITIVSIPLCDRIMAAKQINSNLCLGLTSSIITTLLVTCLNIDESLAVIEKVKLDLINLDKVVNK